MLISILRARYLIRTIFFRKMPEKAIIETVKENAKRIQQEIEHFENEIGLLSAHYTQLRIKQLQNENNQLQEAVEKAKRVLTCLEQQGVPDVSQTSNSTTSQRKSDVSAAQKVPASKVPVEKKKPKDVKTESEIVDVGRLDLRVAKIVDVKKHPDADSLYVLSVNCGGDKPRTVCSGLVKHVPIDELANRSVILLCNLKPVKMRGITSEAMVMCASTPDKVEVLLPPANGQPGDKIVCEGFASNPDAVLNPKKKIFETVATDLLTNASLEACYKGVPLEVDGKGRIVAKTLRNVAIK